MKIISNPLRLLVLLLTVMAFASASAQKIIATKTVIDVGKTGYRMPVTAVFEFRNKSLKRLKIDDVRPDCNCTKIDFPQEEIGMGEHFRISMTYDASQLGHFDKQAAIISNGSKKPIYIRMKGIVLADWQDFSNTYPIEIGDLRLDRNILEFDDVYKGFIQVQELYIYNNGTRAYEPNLMHLPEYLTAAMSPQRLPPGRAGKMTVTLNSDKLHDYGLTQTSVYLGSMPGDKVRPENEISCSAVLLPAVSELTAEQREYAPHLRLSSDNISFAFGKKSKQKAVIELTNTGRTPLNISSLQMFTGGLTIQLTKRRLAPGESSKLKVTGFREQLMQTRVRPRILMICNDPDRPKVTIEVKSE